MHRSVLADFEGQWPILKTAVAELGVRVDSRVLAPFNSRWFLLNLALARFESARAGKAPV
jgi:hypothetical protein